MPETSLPAEHLFTITCDLTPPVVIPNGPHGTRVIVNVTGGTFEGPQVKGTVAAGPGGDWLTMAPDGSLRLDVRLLLTTSDDVPVLMSYAGVAVPGEGGALSIRTAPRFEVGDERYAWLNQVQAVATGRSAEGTVTYEVYRLL